MSRPRTIPDSTVYSAILDLIEKGGERAVAFSSVARATGLAAPSLVQRYGSLNDMLHTALAGVWDRIDQETDRALAEVRTADKGVQALLKALSPAPSAALLAASSRSQDLSLRAGAWRAKVEAAVAGLTGDPDRAAMLFALWAGQSVWEPVAARPFKLKDAIKRLS